MPVFASGARSAKRPVQRGDSPALSAEAVDVAGLGKVTLTLAIIAIVMILDIVTKMWVVQTITLYDSVPVIGDFFRLTYTHNRGAAFGINVGEHSRVFFLILSLVALGVLALIYRSTPVWDRLRVVALSLVAGGALGNILDRIRFERGVVDFLDFGIGASRFPVFNMADTAVSIGAALLLISFYLEGRREHHEEAVD